MRRNTSVSSIKQQGQSGHEKPFKLDLKLKGDKNEPTTSTHRERPLKSEKYERRHSEMPTHSKEQPKSRRMSANDTQKSQPAQPKKPIPSFTSILKQFDEEEQVDWADL
jgi:outer membrane protein assembly factor BamE (lipoprotein component of BamABCDE complex)